MGLSAIILASISLIISLGCAVTLLVKHFSTHKIEILDSALIKKHESLLSKSDKKINEKLDDKDHWL